MTKRGKTVRRGRGRGRGRTQRRGRTQKRGRTQRRRRTQRQRGGVPPMYEETLLQRISRENMEKIEADAKKNFEGVELNGENLYEEYKNLKKRGFDSDDAYNDIAARIKNYQKKEVMTPLTKPMTRLEIQQLNRLEREAAASRKAEMIARRAAAEAEAQAAAEAQAVAAAAQAADRIAKENAAAAAAQAAAAANRIAKAVPMSTKEKAIAFMNEIHLAPGNRAEFMANLRKLGGDEKALETIMNDNEYIEHLMRFEKQAIAFMNEIHLAQDKRAEFMAKFRELSALRGDEKALAEIMTYNGDFLKSLTDISSRDNRPVSLKSVPYQYQDSSLSQHYNLNGTPVTTPGSLKSVPYQYQDSSLSQHYNLNI